MRDKRQERGGVDGNTRYDRDPKAPNTKKFGSGKTALQKEMEKKHGKGASAMDIVKAEMEKKYGKGAVMSPKKKEEDKRLMKTFKDFINEEGYDRLRDQKEG